MVKMTKAQRREWDKLISGKAAKVDVLERAGLVTCSTEIRISGKAARFSSVAELTEAGRRALQEEEGQR